MTYQSKFLSYNECTSLVGFLVTEEAMFVWSQEVNGKSLYHLSIFVFMEKCSKKKVLGFPHGSVVKNLPANAGDTGLIPDPGWFHMLWSY